MGGGGVKGRRGALWKPGQSGHKQQTRKLVAKQKNPVFFHTGGQQEEGKEKRGSQKEGEILYSLFFSYGEEG